jgi:hypothetical protein
MRTGPTGAVKRSGGVKLRRQTWEGLATLHKSKQRALKVSVLANRMDAGTCKGMKVPGGPSHAFLRLGERSRQEN